MFVPSSTYRIQLNDAFTFQHLTDIVGYLHELGISTIYASPITTAVKGSKHGYDVADALTINPEIGTEQQLESLARTLDKFDMSWLQDIVPNHMAYDASNPWLHDVLERGRDSPYYGFFDIMAGENERLMAPFLGQGLSDCLDKGEISLQLTEKGFVIRYFDNEYPVAAHLYRWIAGAVETLPGRSLSSDPGTWADTKSQWLRDVGSNAASRKKIIERVSLINEQRPLLEELLQNQHYLLTNAGDAATRINYRRFFTINGLICLSMEKPEVFTLWHQTLHRWHHKGWIDGLRVDHIDGLADPKTYLQRLRALFGDDCYVVAEKILTGTEVLREDWPLEGTTGYDFLAAAGQALTDADGSRRLLDFYCNKIISLKDYYTVIYERKLNFLYKFMGGEVNHLLRLLEDFSPRLKEALSVWMASFPVYRAYPDNHVISPADSAIFMKSMEEAKKRRPDLLPELDRLAGLCDGDERGSGTQRPAFLTRLMQFTGPLAAKGIEDTTFYVYNPYIAHCEVGDSPAIAGIAAEEFHRRMQDRYAHWRHTLNATTTHDTKRGEDSRIRLSFLSAIPNEWIDAVMRWREVNVHLIQSVAGRPAPSPNDEYLIYQSLLGGFPGDGVITDVFRERFAGWLLKALREAKTETSYETPDEGYEQQCQTFASALLRTDSRFLSDFGPFARDIIRRSAPYCLSQLLLKATAPGVPDIYQGAELWELSFVDPDNRRPVDFALRANLLRQLKMAEERGTGAVFDLLRQHREPGIEKLFLLYRVLHCRRRRPSLFSDGEYIPVPCKGAWLAFLRRHGNDWALVAVPLPSQQQTRPATMTLPAGAPDTWMDNFTGAKIHTGTDIAAWPDGLPEWPVILLTSGTGGE